jgi:hypothetical protein
MKEGIEMVLCVSHFNSREFYVVLRAQGQVIHILVAT